MESFYSWRCERFLFVFCSDEELTLETSAVETLYFIYFINLVDKIKFFVIQHILRALKLLTFHQVCETRRDFLPPYIENFEGF